MTATTAKKVEGKIEEINPTTIVVSKKTIYLPPEKRGWFTALGLKEDDEVRVIYDMKGNIINTELLKYGELKEIQKNKFVPQKVVETELEKAKKLHINQGKVEEAAPLKSGGSEPEVYIHKESTELIKKDWVTGKEKNDTILLQSVLARSVEIVNAQYRDYPEIDYKDTSFADLLDTRCNHIEYLTDRLFTHIKKKLKEEQV